MYRSFKHRIPCTTCGEDVTVWMARDDPPVTVYCIGGITAGGHCIRFAGRRSTPPPPPPKQGVLDL